MKKQERGTLGNKMPNKSLQTDNLRAVRLVVSLSLHFTTRRTSHKLRVNLALSKIGGQTIASLSIYVLTRIRLLKSYLLCFFPLNDSRSTENIGKTLKIEVHGTDGAKN